MKNREWEIGIVSIRLCYNYNLLTLPKNQPGLIMLKKELTSINSSEEDIKFEVLDRLKSTWFLPEIPENELTVDNLMLELQTFIIAEGMKMNSYKVKLDGKDKMYYMIEERQKGKWKMKTTIIIHTCLFISI